MEIKRRDHGAIAVLDIEGKLAGGISGDRGLSEAVLESVRADEAQADSKALDVLLNLAACTGADSLGIGELISLHVSLSNRGGTLKLLHLPGRIKDLLRATQLISMFEIFDDEAEALESFG